MTIDRGNDDFCQLDWRNFGFSTMGFISGRTKFIYYMRAKRAYYCRESGKQHETRNMVNQKTFCQLKPSDFFQNTRSRVSRDRVFSHIYLQTVTKSNLFLLLATITFSINNKYPTNEPQFVYFFIKLASSRDFDTLVTFNPECTVMRQKMWEISSNRNPNFHLIQLIYIIYV